MAKIIYKFKACISLTTDDFAVGSIPTSQQGSSSEGYANNAGREFQIRKVFMGSVNFRGLTRMNWMTGP